MFRRTHRLPACLVALLVPALVGECGGLWANQEPRSEVQHWSVVSRPAVGPDGTIYVLGAIGDQLPDAPYGPGRDYLYALGPDGTQKWSFALGGGEIYDFFPPKIGPSGTVYVADRQQLYAIDSKGARKWKVPFTGELSWLDFGSHGAIYFYADKLLHALSPDGTLKWKKSTQAMPMVGPDGTVYLTADNLLYAINPDGAQKWSLALGKGPIHAVWPPNPKSGIPWAIYVVGSNNLYAVAPNGAEKWKFPFTGSPDSLDFGPDGTIHFCASNLLYALKADGTLKWKFHAPPPGKIHGLQPPVGPDGTVYVWGEEDDSVGRALYAIKSDGTLKWQWPSDSDPDSAPLQILEVKGVGADGTLYVERGAGSWGGVLAAVGPDGSNRWEYGLGSFSLVLGADGTIYVADNLMGTAGGSPATGALYALTPSGAQKWSFDRLCVGNRNGCPRRVF